MCFTSPGIYIPKARGKQTEEENQEPTGVSLLSPSHAADIPLCMNTQGASASCLAMIGDPQATPSQACSSLLFTVPSHL